MLFLLWKFMVSRTIDQTVTFDDVGSDEFRFCGFIETDVTFHSGFSLIGPNTPPPVTQSYNQLKWWHTWATHPQSFEFWSALWCWPKCWRTCHTSVHQMGNLSVGNYRQFAPMPWATISLCHYLKHAPIDSPASAPVSDWTVMIPKSWSLVSKSLQD